MCPDKRRPEENKDKVLLGYTAQVRLAGLGDGLWPWRRCERGMRKSGGRGHEACPGVRLCHGDGMGLFALLCLSRSYLAFIHSLSD